MFTQYLKISHVLLHLLIYLAPSQHCFEEVHYIHFPGKAREIQRIQETSQSLNARCTHHFTHNYVNTDRFLSLISTLSSSLINGIIHQYYDLFVYLFPHVIIFHNLLSELSDDNKLMKGGSFVIPLEKFHCDRVL